MFLKGLLKYTIKQAIHPRDGFRMKKFIINFINLNIKLSNWFDITFLPKKYYQDGLKDYVKNTVPKYLKAPQTIVDIGGGKRPFIGTEAKKVKGMRIVGIDISKKELNLAPKGIYEEKIVADIGARNQEISLQKADIIICEAVLEHIKNINQAVNNISNMLSKKGVALVYVPCKNAPFAKLNRLLPEAFKRKLLYFFLPSSQHAQGFPAYYNNCTPKNMEQLFLASKVKRVKTIKHYHSNYFAVMFPVHIIWRLSQVVKGLCGLDNCESFTLIIEK